MAMKLTTGILAMAMMTGGAWAQNPNIINNVQNTMNSVQQKKTADSNAALDAAGVPKKAPEAKPTAATTPQTKPAAAVKSTTTQTAKPAAASAPKTAATNAPAKPHDPMVPQTAPMKTAQSKTAQIKPAKRAHAHPVIAAKAEAKPATTKIAAKPETAAPDAKITDAIKAADAKTAKPEDKKWAMTGKRDPFFSPVVQQPTGSGCSTGKKCLEIGQINLRGVVRSDSGFIAVVTNNLNKAYFLRENDPVFNGYVVKITGDSVVFQETVQDKLGKPFTREVVKRLFTPAV
jgi:membrane protein involved in colicin uptake